MNELFNGAGYIPWDFFVASAASLIGLVHFWKLGSSRELHNIFFKIGRFIAGVGWLTWGLRFFYQLAQRDDPLITLPGLLSITFIVVGTLVINLFGNTEEKER